MNNYADVIMQNHQFLSDSSDGNMKSYGSLLVQQYGGDTEDENDKVKYTATGSFPPIYIMTSDDIKKEEEMEKSRSFAKKDIALSIKDIMKDRRDDKKPFITL